MLESKILPTILIILPSSVFLLVAHPGAGKAAAEKCNTRPSSSAPQGTHWYYRINSADNRRCWFLSSEDIKVRSHARELISSVPSPSPVPQHGNEPARATAPQTRPALTASARMAPANMLADTAFTESSMPQREMAMDFAARWPDRPEFTNINVSALALMSNSYADTPGATDAEDELSLRSFDTETGQRQQNPAGETAFRLALLAAALGLVSLTVVGSFEIARRAGQPYVRASWRAVAGLPNSLRRMRADLINLTDSSPMQERYAVRRDPRPTDPVQDLKVSLSELMGDLRRANAASYSPRSFAPSPRQMHKRAADKNQVSFEARFGFGLDEGRVLNPAAERTHEVLEIPAIV